MYFILFGDRGSRRYNGKLVLREVTKDTLLPSRNSEGFPIDAIYRGSSDDINMFQKKGLNTLATSLIYRYISENEICIVNLLPPNKRKKALVALLNGREPLGRNEILNMVLNNEEEDDAL